MVYDIEVSRSKIAVWMQQIICHSQQNKAKIDVFEQLNEESGLWLKMCYLLNLGKDSVNILVKKGCPCILMNFFLKNDGVVSKYVYFTVIYRCDQGVESTLCISDNLMQGKVIPHRKSSYTVALS